MLQQRHIVASINIDNIKAGCSCAFCGICIPATNIANVSLVHRSCLNRIVRVDRHCRNSHRRNTAVLVGRMMTVINQFHGSQSTKLVDGPGGELHGRNICIIPKPSFGVGTYFRTRVNFYFLGTNDTPAPLRFDPPIFCLCLRPYMPKRVTVGNLIKSIGRRDRTNPDRLEQTIEAGLRHGGCRHISLHLRLLSVRWLMQTFATVSLQRRYPSDTSLVHVDRMETE